MISAKEQWLASALGFQREQAPMDGFGDGPTLVLKPEEPQTLDISLEDSFQKWQREMEEEARRYIEEYIRIHGVLPIFDKLMKLPWFRAMIEAQDAAIRRQAAEEITARIAREQAILRQLEEEQRARLKVKQEAVAQLGASVVKAEQRREAYAEDPNGYLLLMKQVTSLGAAVSALLRTLPSDTDNPGVAELRNALTELEDRLRSLGVYAEDVLRPLMGNMKEHIESRRQHLGYDIGNKKFVDQEGQVGADIEMQFGGLVRSTTPDVEFETGALGPFPRPVTLDVFGQRIDSMLERIRFVVSDAYVEALEARLGRSLSKKELTAIRKVLNSDRDRLYDYFFAVMASGPPPALNLGQPIIAGVDVQGVAVFRDRMLASFWATHNFLQQLKDHLAKAFIVPFDISGLAPWPEIVDLIQSFLRQHLGADYHRILWYDVGKRPDPNGGGNA